MGERGGGSGGDKQDSGAVAVLAERDVGY